MGRKVVVIDDDEWSGSAIGDVLADAGWDVQLMADGRSGLEALQAIDGGPCVALIDLMLPDLSGWDIVERLRRDPRTASIPVVTTSAAIIEDPPPDTIFVRKPFSIADLLAAVNAAWKGSEAARP